MRRGKTLALTRNNVDFTEGTISISKAITRKKDGTSFSLATKPEAGNRIIDIDTKTAQLLNDWYELKANQQFVFSNSKESHIPLSQPIRKKQRMNTN